MSETNLPAITFNLRDYQKACLEAILERYRSGVRRQLACLPTGSGKTVIFAEFPRYFKMKKQMLVLAHRRELLDQARDKIHSNQVFRWYLVIHHCKLSKASYKNFYNLIICFRPFVLQHLPNWVIRSPVLVVI